MSLVTNTLIQATWKLVSHLSSRALDSASERIIDVQPDEPEEEDEDGQDSAQGTQETGETPDAAHESKKDI